jgi:hypothetical protein
VGENADSNCSSAFRSLRDESLSQHQTSIWWRSTCPGCLLAATSVKRVSGESDFLRDKKQKQLRDFGFAFKQMNERDRRIRLAVARQMAAKKSGSTERSETVLHHLVSRNRCGLHRTAIGLLERAERVPRLDTLLTVSRGFGITVSQLLQGVEKKSLANSHR